MYQEWELIKSYYKKTRVGTQVKPMLLTAATDIPLGKDWLYEPLSKVFLKNSYFNNIFTLFIYK